MIKAARPLIMAVILGRSKVMFALEFTKLIICSFAHYPRFLKLSLKSVQNFLSHFIHSQTNKERRLGGEN